MIAAATFAVVIGASAQEPAPVDAAKPAEAAEAAADEQRLSRRERRRRRAAEDAATAAADSAPGAESKRECRNQKITGSRLPRMVCMSAEEWAVRDAQEQQALQDVFRRRNESTPVQAEGGAPAF